MSPLLCLSLTVVNLSQIKQNLFYMENIKFIIQGYLLEKGNMSDFFGFVPLMNLGLRSNS